MCIRVKTYFFDPMELPPMWVFDNPRAPTNRRRRSATEEKGPQFGHAFEHFMLMQLSAHSSYQEIHYPICFWRTKSGLEVDFILGNGQVAMEVKGTNRVDAKELKPLQAFMDEHSPGRALVVANESARRVCGRIEILPWREFLDELVGGQDYFLMKDGLPGTPRRCF